MRPDETPWEFHARLRDRAPAQPAASAEAMSKLAGPVGSLGVVGGSLAGGETAEAYFVDRDIFLIYVEDKVNPARAESGLDTISRAAASHLFDVIDSRRYRLPSGKQENTEISHAPSAQPKSP